MCNNHLNDLPLPSSPINQNLFKTSILSRSCENEKDRFSARKISFLRSTFLNIQSAAKRIRIKSLLLCAQVFNTYQQKPASR